MASSFDITLAPIILFGARRFSRRCSGELQHCSRWLRRWSQPLRRSFHAWRRPPSLIGGLAALPPEIIWLILEHLPASSRLSFALTCRFFFFRYRPKPVELFGVRCDFIQLLERDMPGFYVCHDCLELHRWRLDWHPFHKGRGARSGDSVASSDPWCPAVNGRCSTLDCVFAENYMLSYNLAHVVMNRHLYGSAHGLPLSVLEGPLRAASAGEDSHKLNVDLRGRWRARIIDDLLLVSAEYTMSHRRGDVDTLREFLGGDAGIICHHIRFGQAGMGFPIGYHGSVPADLQCQFQIP